MRIPPGTAAALALAACGATPPAAPLANTGSTTALTFTELRFYIGPQLVEKLHDDGTIEVALRVGDWETFGRIDARGAAFRADGTRLGYLASDGTFRRPSGEPGSWKLIGETLMFPDGPVPERSRKLIQLTIDARGVLQGFADADPSYPSYKFEGLTDRGSRRAALYMYAIVLTGRYEPR